MTRAFLLFLPVDLAILNPAFALVAPVLVNAQPTFQLLRAALLVGRRVAFAPLLASGILSSSSSA